VSFNSIAVITLFPEMFNALTNYGVTGRAFKSGLISLIAENPRDYTEDKHRTVDDRPYGGGPGMIMKPEPLLKAIRAAKAKLPSDKETKVVYLSPAGRSLRHQDVVSFAQIPNLVLIAGRYEGIDERVCQLEIDEEISIGDYVLSGGELPAMVLLDALIRQIPGALGHPDSVAQDSFGEQMNGQLDCPHYTRPEALEGMSVPEVLLSGDHAAIEQWRREQALERTRLRRPDLLADQNDPGSE